jgi:hypothetical protein
MKRLGAGGGMIPKRIARLEETPNLLSVTFMAELLNCNSLMRLPCKIVVSYILDVTH